MPSHSRRRRQNKLPLRPPLWLRKHRTLAAHRLPNRRRSLRRRRRSSRRRLQSHRPHPRHRVTTAMVASAAVVVSAAAMALLQAVRRPCSKPTPAPAAQGDDRPANAADDVIVTAATMAVGPRGPRLHSRRSHPHRRPCNRRSLRPRSETTPIAESVAGAAKVIAVDLRHRPASTAPRPRRPCRNRH